VTSDTRRSPVPFEARVEAADDGAVLKLAGELDVACEEAFGRAVAEALAEGRDDLEVDLRELSFIDSSGLRFLIELWKRSEKEGFALSVVQGTGVVRRTFEIAGLDRLLPIVDPR
jgi:anti-anti-sigma factor